MRVFERIDNYDVFPLNQLSEEEDEQLAADLKKIVEDLIPLRSSKRKTRQYFTKYLRLDFNIRENQYRNEALGRIGDNFVEYTPKPGEYKWRSDILQPALIDVLYEDRYSFGHIYNLLNFDIADRRGTDKWPWEVIPDSLIQFYLEFDFDSIRDEVSKTGDIRRRIILLREKLTAYETCQYLSYEERQDWGKAFEERIGELISLEEKRLELYPSGFERTVPTPSPEPVKSDSRDLFNIVYDYCEKDDQISNTAYTLLLKAVNLENSTVDRSMVEEMFTFVDNCFAHFLETCELLTHDKIGDIFNFTDHWYEHFKDAIDDANTRCQQSIKVSVQKKHTSLQREVLNKIALTYANFIIEKAIIVVSGFKANILYNHRYEIEVYYNIKDDPLEAYFAERDRLEGKFGAGQERDIYFDRDTNIDAFYDKVTRLVHDGLIEATINSNAFEEEDEVPQYIDKVRTLIEQGLPFYVEFMKLTHGLNSEAYHEASSWIETTRYCMGNVIIAAELWAACDEKRSALVNYSSFQQLNIEFLPKLLDENLLKYKSDTGDFDIDDKLNDLGERDADEWDYAVPVFDPEVLTDTFITKAAIDDAIRNDPSRVFSASNILSGEEAEAYLKQLDSERQKEKRPFSEGPVSHILLAGRESDVIKYINEHIDRNVPTKAISLLIAARELGYTGKLTHSVAEGLFGQFASRSTYNSYYNGARAVDRSNVETYKTALEKHFKSSPSSTL